VVSGGRIKFYCYSVHALVSLWCKATERKVDYVEK
jgi:hypothetical protein